jgi:regulator of cell morphogenesis and NO signaling
MTTITITDALRGEHGVFYAQFDHIEGGLATVDLAGLKTQGALLASALAPHAHLENDILFPALERELGGDGGPLTVFRAEHAEIEDALEKLQTLRELSRHHDDIEGTLQRLPRVEDVAVARRLVGQTLAIARDHFSKEEHMLFPMAEQMLSEDALERLGEQWAAQRHVVLA